MTLASNECYQRNLVALKALQPLVAAAIDSAPIPEKVTPATGRDGTETVLVPGDHGRPVWLGGCSMPRVSAEEVLHNLSRDGGSVLLPGILTGVEPLVAADRLAPHLAVFVAEPRPGAVRLAMHLYDYTELFECGRLVLLIGEDVEASLHEFFEAHPGYEMPVQLCKFPQQSAAQSVELHRRVEAAAEGVLMTQARFVNSCAEVINRRFENDGARREIPSEPRVVLVSADARGEALEQAARIGRALTRLRWRFELCLPDAPAKCHLSARLRVVEDAGGDLVLSVNGISSSARALLPAELPVVSWYHPGARIDRLATEQVGPFDLFLASSPGQQAELASVGAPTGAIERCDAAADDTVYYPLRRSAGERCRSDLEVAVLVDIPDDRPEAADVTLPSHVALWRAMQQAVDTEVAYCRDEAAGELLERAQRVSGTTICEASIRNRFLELIRTRIAPVAVARAAVRALVEAGRRVTVWGSDSSGLFGGGEESRGPIPFGRDLNSIFNDADWVVMLGPAVWMVQMAIDGLSAGVSVACRAGNVPFSGEYPALGTLGPHIHFFRTGCDLVNLTQVRGSPGLRCDERSAAGRNAVLAGHTVSHRITRIVGQVRQRQVAALATGDQR